MNEIKLSKPPLDGIAVQLLENALLSAPNKSIRVEINHVLYQLSREGQWFKFSRLTKKRTIKKSTIFATLSDVYNEMIHGHMWKIAQYVGA
jgi:hypothetical protein